MIDTIKHQVWLAASRSMTGALAMLPRKGGLGDGAELAVLAWLANRYGTSPAPSGHRPDWPGIAFNDSAQQHFVREVMIPRQSEYSSFAHAPTADPGEFYLANDYFQSVDAETLHCVIRHAQPQRVIEVGSGHSTKISHSALRLNGRGTLICIDPMPRSEIAGLADEIHRQRAETVSPNTFDQLEANDILFIDSSHRLWPEGDVTYLFHRVLPRLRPGVLVHIHDIFLPFDYPAQFWNNANTEQDLFAAFLAFNTEFEVMVSSAYLYAEHRALLESAVPPPWTAKLPSSFWVRRV